MRRTSIVAGLAVALLLGTPFAAAAPLTGTGYFNPSGPTSPMGLNVGLQANTEEAAMRNMLGGRRSSGFVKHRAPGERAHRRWRQRRRGGAA